MAKRRNPFEEDYVPQSKVHVGIKQFNNNDDRLKEVYGAMKLARDPCIASNISNAKDNLKQLFIGKNGALQLSGNMVPRSMKAKQCTCGRGVESQCAYCEQVLCGSCLHNCTRCEEPYCTHCVLGGSEGLEVCLSCCG